MKKIYISLLALLVLLTAIPVFSATIGGGEKYILSKNDTISGNLYVGGGTVSIIGNVNGDVISGGGEVVIDGSVSDDVLIGGGRIMIQGAIGGDARVVGGDINISNNVGGDVVAAGGSLRINSNATVKEDVLMAGGRLLIDGVVKGKVTSAGGEVEINGTVEGNVVVRSNNLTIGDGAVLKGTVEYFGKNRAKISDGASLANEIVFHESARKKFEGSMVFAWLAGLFSLIKLLSALTAGIIFVLVFKKLSRDLVTNGLGAAGRNALIGFIILVVTPFAIIVILATVLGILIGIFGAVLYIGLLILANIFGGVIFGGLLARWSKRDEDVANWKWAALGIFSLQLIGIIPILGLIIIFAFFLIALGTIVESFYQHVWLNR